MLLLHLLPWLAGKATSLGCVCERVQGADLPPPCVVYSVAQPRWQWYNPHNPRVPRVYVAAAGVDEQVHALETPEAEQTPSRDLAAACQTSSL